MAGFEPTISCLEGSCPIRLGHIGKSYIFDWALFIYFFNFLLLIQIQLIHIKYRKILNLRLILNFPLHYIIKDNINNY
jgi:hypothetical protein